MMLPPQATTVVPLPPTFDRTRWVKANAGQASLCRVLYDPPLLQQLVAALAANLSIIPGTTT
jgi:hypothetical protein